MSKANQTQGSTQMTQISDEQLDRIQAYCDKATPGPWIQEIAGTIRDILGDRFEDEHGSAATKVAEVLGNSTSQVITQANADFIENARTDLPLLVKDLRHARQENARIAAELDAHKGMTSRAIDRELRAKDELDAARKVARNLLDAFDIWQMETTSLNRERLGGAFAELRSSLPSPAASQGGEACEHRYVPLIGGCQCVRCGHQIAWSTELDMPPSPRDWQAINHALDNLSDIFTRLRIPKDFEVAIVTGEVQRGLRLVDFIATALASTSPVVQGGEEVHRPLQSAVMVNGKWQPDTIVYLPQQFEQANEKDSRVPNEDGQVGSVSVDAAQARGGVAPVSEVVDEARASAATAQSRVVAVTDEMVNRFLAWPLPASVMPDADKAYPHRTGTNLLNDPEARQMLEHVLVSTPPLPAVGGQQGITAGEALDALNKLVVSVWAPGERDPKEVVLDFITAANWPRTQAEVDAVLAEPAGEHADTPKASKARVERVIERIKASPTPAVGGRDTQAPAEAGEVERLREALEDSTNLLKSVPDEEGQIAAQIKDNEAALASDSGVKRD